MTRRARDGGLYFADGRIAGACVLFVRCGSLDSDKARVFGVGARSLYARRPMAPVGVEIV